MNLNISNPIYIYPWGNAHSQVVAACRVIQVELRKRGVDFKFTTNSGIPVGSDNSVGGRGWYKDGRIWLHSGKSPTRPGVYKAPFTTLDGMGRILLHEWMHAKGWRNHDDDGVMHKDATGWPDPAEVAWLKRIYGAYTPPPPKPKPTKEVLVKRRNAKRKERDELKAEIAKLTDQIKRLNKRIEEA